MRCLLTLLDNTSETQYRKICEQSLIQPICFLGYQVILLHRVGSAFPFASGLRESASKHIDGDLLSNLEDRKQGIYLAVPHGGRLKSELRCYNHSVKNKKLFSFSFETVSDYLTLLQLVSEQLNHLGDKVCFYLAAAVSDFYIPEDEVSTKACCISCVRSSLSENCRHRYFDLRNLNAYESVLFAPLPYIRSNFYVGIRKIIKMLTF